MVNTEQASRHNDEMMCEPEHAAQTHQMSKLEKKKYKQREQHTQDAQLQWLKMFFRTIIIITIVIIIKIEILSKDLHRN